MSTRQGDTTSLTKISFAGKTWIDARSLPVPDGEDFAAWMQGKISLFGLADGLDCLRVDYVETGMIRGGTECLLSLNAAELLLGEGKPARRAHEERQNTNPYHIA